MDMYKHRYIDANVSKQIQTVMANSYLITSALVNHEIRYVWSF